MDLKIKMVGNERILNGVCFTGISSALFGRKQNVLIKNLDEGFDKGYTYNIAILQYVVAKQSAVKITLILLPLKHS